MKRLLYFFVWLSNCMSNVHKSAKDMNNGYATEQVKSAKAELTASERKRAIELLNK